jgi:hypothetical protein
MDDLQSGFPTGDLFDRTYNVTVKGLAEGAALLKTVAPERLADDTVMEDEVDEGLTVLFNDERLLILGFPDFKGVLTTQEVRELA